MGSLVLAVVLGALLGRFVLAGDGQPTPRPRAGRAPAGPAPSAPTVERIAALQARLQAAPDQPGLLTQLGTAYLTRARETADPTWYSKAAEALTRSAALAPDDLATLVGLGLLDLTRHDFGGALALGMRVVARDPADLGGHAILTDALVELGRYDEAIDSAAATVAVRPGVASYSRVSYLRELTGDVDGALAAMRQAVADATAPADRAYVGTLVGDLELGRGRLDAAESDYRAVLADAPDNGAAQYGLARVSAARGDLVEAIRILEPLVQRLPLPATVALLGDVYEAAGRPLDAHRQYDLVRVVEKLNEANGVSVDLETARFEADHAHDVGADPTAVVALARRALTARPTVFAHDALAWSLRQAGDAASALPLSREAVRLGTQDAALWYHLAAIEADLGRRSDAAAHLRRAFAIDPYLTLRDLPAARRLAAAIGVMEPRP